MRVNFQTKVLVSTGEIFWDILKKESYNSDLVMLGLKIPDENYGDYGSLQKVVEKA